MADEIKNTFVCEDCKKELPIRERFSSEYDICHDCLENYDNRTGHCSTYCRITGECDGAC